MWERNFNEEECIEYFNKDLSKSVRQMACGKYQILSISFEPDLIYKHQIGYAIDLKTAFLLCELLEGNNDVDGELESLSFRLDKCREAAVMLNREADFEIMNGDIVIPGAAWDEFARRINAVTEE